MSLRRRKPFPVHRMKMPSDLQGVPNGNVPADLLRGIKPSGRLHHCAARGWVALSDMAAREGLQLAQVGDYRPLAQQEALFMQRMRDYPDAKRARQVTRTYRGKVWYLHVGAPVATPATSNHGYGLAIDAALRLKKGRVVSIATRPKGARRSGLDFLLEHAVSLGWSWELQVEPWHLRWYAGDRVPTMVILNEIRER